MRAVTAELERQVLQLAGELPKRWAMSTATERDRASPLACANHHSDQGSGANRTSLLAGWRNGKALELQLARNRASTAAQTLALLVTHQSPHTAPSSSPNDGWSRISRLRPHPIRVPVRSVSALVSPGSAIAPAAPFVAVVLRFPSHLVPRGQPPRLDCRLLPNPSEFGQANSEVLNCQLDLTQLAIVLGYQVISLRKLFVHRLDGCFIRVGSRLLFLAFFLGSIQPILQSRERPIDSSILQQTLELLSQNGRRIEQERDHVLS